MRNLMWIGLICIVAGPAIAYLGWNEKKVADSSTQSPEEISLKDLIARGPNGNPNIILTGFEPCTNYVVTMKGNTWNSAWVPIVVGVPGQNAEKTTNASALVFTLNARDEGSLYGLVGVPKLKALVTNNLMSIGSEEKKLLQQSYPGTDFAKCLIIQQGREPAGALQVWGMIGGGAVLAVIGLGCLVGGFVRWQRGV